MNIYSLHLLGLWTSLPSTQCSFTLNGTKVPLFSYTILLHFVELKFWFSKYSMALFTHLFNRAILLHSNFKLNWRNEEHAFCRRYRVSFLYMPCVSISLIHSFVSLFTYLFIYSFIHSAFCSFVSWFCLLCLSVFICIY